MGVVSIRLNEQKEIFFKSYAKLTGRPLSELFKQALAEDIEDALDLNIYRQAVADYEEDPATISHADFKKQLGF